jgi:hypothetical protein
MQERPATNTSLLSILTPYNSFFAAALLVQDDIGSGFPDERLGSIFRWAGHG